MRYFKTNKEVFAFDEEQIEKGLSNGMTELTEDQLEKHIDSNFKFIDGDWIDARTYVSELSALNSKKAAKEKEFAEKFALIIGRDGPTEDPAKAAIRNNLLNKIDSDYLAEKNELKQKYGVI